MISKKFQSNFIKITLRHECSPVNLLHIFRTPFYKNTYGGLLLDTAIVSYLKWSHFNRLLLPSKDLYHPEILVWLPRKTYLQIGERYVEDLNIWCLFTSFSIHLHLYSVIWRIIWRIGRRVEWSVCVGRRDWEILRFPLTHLIYFNPDDYRLEYYTLLTLKEIAIALCASYNFI